MKCLIKGLAQYSLSISPTIFSKLQRVPLELADDKLSELEADVDYKQTNSGVQYKAYKIPM